jgi:hypothetical protein
MIGLTAFIHPTRNYKWYSAISDLHTLQFTVTRILSFSFFTSRILGTDFNTGAITVSLNQTHQMSLYYSIHKVFPSQPDCKLSLLPTLLKRLPLPSQEIPSIVIQKQTLTAGKRAPLGPMAIDLFSVKTFACFSSLFLPLVRGGVGLFI